MATPSVFDRVKEIRGEVMADAERYLVRDGATPTPEECLNFAFGTLLMRVAVLEEKIRTTNPR